MKELYDAAGEMKSRVISEGIRIIDSAIEIRRIQRMTVEGWETSHFSLLLFSDPHVWLLTNGRIYASWLDDELILHFSDEEMERVREIHGYLEEW
ncbi:hypothetical protein [Archaeoglobus neptunius]|uniref:hypothetical protein n=1 Tax=Archaeoglobus neptunius TaxID=2798580 RepID=UPI001927D48F|nr:hypothetical protein [Archaeoglobus neptunius]